MPDFPTTPSPMPLRIWSMLGRVLGLALIAYGVFSLGEGLFERASETPLQTKGRTAIAPLPEASRRQPCEVLFVYDGDTFACDLNHNHQVDKPVEQIRMIGVDTPEMHYSHKNKTGQDAPFAKAASTYSQQALSGRTVHLERDVRGEDKFGRTLAYVYLSATDNEPFNQQLLRQGLATPFFIPPNLRYEQSFLEASAQAESQKLGLWHGDEDSRRVLKGK